MGKDDEMKRRLFMVFVLSSNKKKKTVRKMPLENRGMGRGRRTGRIINGGGEGEVMD